MRTNAKSRYHVEVTSNIVFFAEASIFGLGNVDGHEAVLSFQLLGRQLIVWFHSLTKSAPRSVKHLEEIVEEG